MTMKSSVLILSAIVLIDCFTVFAAAELTAVVKTTSGPVQGEILTTVNSVKYASFKGIRYAQAPVGYLRFKPPVAVEPWTETLNATVEGDDCPQIDPFKEIFSGSEDCLFLNIMTPVTNMNEAPKIMKPVMVWIYGGGFSSGTSSTRLYRPDYIIEEDVIYVAFNYRVGPLGFLTLRHQNATGNAGLKDQVLALKWVRANIKKFGGNPNNVTIFGQSAGAGSVGFHVLSDASTGLFHGAISMSGVSLLLDTDVTSSAAEAQAQNLGAALGAKSISKDEILRTLYNASVEDIINVASESSVFGPTIEDESIATDVFLSQCSLIKYFTGNFNKVPQMLGFTSQEAINNFSPLEPVMHMLNGTLDAFENQRSEWPQKLIDAKNIINTWMGGELDNNELQTLINVATDIVYKAEIDLTQRVLAVNNDDKPIYYYQVSYLANVMLHNIHMNNPLKGVGHIDDLGFLFYFPELNYSSDPTDPTRRTIDRITTMWTNFAKYSNPTPDWVRDDCLNVTWPNSGLSGTTLDIGAELVVKPRLIDDVAKFVQLVSWPHLGKRNGCQA